MIRVVAIDDEPLALQLVKEYVEKTPFLELAGVFDNPVEAVASIKSSDVDLVLLDIQMPDLTGTAGRGHQWGTEGHLYHGI